MNKNGESYSNALEGHRQRARCGRYYKLRMAELIHALEAMRLLEQNSNIFDEPILNDHTPVLQPTSWRPSNATIKIKQNIKILFTKGMQKFKYFGE